MTIAILAPVPQAVQPRAHANFHQDQREAGGLGDEAKGGQQVRSAAHLIGLHQACRQDGHDLPDSPEAPREGTEAYGASSLQG